MGSEDNNKEDEIMLLYHWSPVIVEKPEIRTAKFHKDFYFGFFSIDACFSASISGFQMQSIWLLYGDGDAGKTLGHKIWRWICQ